MPVAFAIVSKIVVGLLLLKLRVSDAAKTDCHAIRSYRIVMSVAVLQMYTPEATITPLSADGRILGSTSHHTGLQPPVTNTAWSPQS